MFFAYTCLVDTTGGCVSDLGYRRFEMYGTARQNWFLRRPQDDRASSELKTGRYIKCAA